MFCFVKLVFVGTCNLTHWPLGDIQKSKEKFSNAIFASWFVDIPIERVWIEGQGSQVNIDSGYGLVPLGNKP